MHLLVTVPEGKWKWDEFHSFIAFFQIQPSGRIATVYSQKIDVPRPFNSKEKMVRRALREEIRRRSPRLKQAM